MRDRAHYTDMLDRNPSATIGFTLAAKMIVAAQGSHGDDDEAVRAVARRLHREYGEVLTHEQVRAEMDATE